MSFSPNFLSVTLRQNANSTKLVVQGATGGNPDEVTAIYVGIAHGKGNFVRAPRRGPAAGVQPPVELQPQGDIQAAAKATSPNGKSWKATIAQTDPEVKAKERVVVIGVAVPRAKTKPPFFWHQTITVE